MLALATEGRPAEIQITANITDNNLVFISRATRTKNR